MARISLLSHLFVMGDAGFLRPSYLAMGDAKMVMRQKRITHDSKPVSPLSLAYTVCVTLIYK